MQIELVSQPMLSSRAGQELVDDPDLAKLPYRIETDRFGRTIMSPPPGFCHVSNVAKITSLLKELLPDGRAFSETPVLTSDRHKGAWTPRGFRRVRSGAGSQRAVGAGARPGEICVEVLSPSNSRPK